MCRAVADIFQAVIAEILQNCGRDIACIFQREFATYCRDIVVMIHTYFRELLQRCRDIAEML
jgi:hypothetical protein